jgi:hypothetical protein
MKKGSRKFDRRSKSNALARALKWLFVLAGIGVVLYGVSRSAGVAYNERNIAVVDFSALTPAEKREALVAANSASCTCGCGMTLAQCVSTDTACPIRDENIKRIRAMVQTADKP